MPEIDLTMPKIKKKPGPKPKGDKARIHVLTFKTDRETRDRIQDIAYSRDMPISEVIHLLLRATLKELAE